MNDLISRQAAIDDLYGRDPSQIWDTADIEVWINALPSAEPERKWIPCSERLPEEYGEYRITWTTSASKKRLIGDSEFEVTGEWDAEGYRFKGKWLLDEYIKNYPDVNVIAWKPLEEPWEGEDDETD